MELKKLANQAFASGYFLLPAALDSLDKHSIVFVQFGPRLSRIGICTVVVIGSLYNWRKAQGCLHYIVLHLLEKT